MQVAKWGNSLAVRLPSAVVEALGLKEGDDIEIRIAGNREFEVARDRSKERRWRGYAVCVVRCLPVSPSAAKKRMNDRPFFDANMLAV
jgi:antitoxin component of MazEF toxin-antitoxin module